MLEPPSDWPQTSCHINPEYEDLVSDIFDLIYIKSKACLDDNPDQEGARNARIEARTRVKETDSVELVGTGAGRFTIAGDVLTDNDHILKIAKYSPRDVNSFPADGLTQNETEANTWDYLTPPLADWFTPLTHVHENYHWIIQPRVDTTTPLPLGDETTTRLLGHIHDEGWAAIELNTTNIGLYNDHVTIYDYGLPIRPYSWFDDLDRDVRPWLK